MSNLLPRRALAQLNERVDAFRAVLVGGPRQAGRSESFRADWFDSYVPTVVLRDVAEFADIRHASRVPQLLRLVAARSGSPSCSPS